MPPRRGRHASCVATAAAVLLSGAAAAAATDGRPWMDPSAPVLQRVEALLAQMTTADKLWQLQRPDYSANLSATGVGLLEFPAFTAGAKTATDVVRARNAAQAALLADGPGKRLGIPAAFRQFAIHGAEAFGVTFPEGPGLGATWDTGLMQDVASAVASEARALGADMMFYVIHMVADARFGRQEEGFSEEPTLTAAMAAAAVAGSHGGALGLPPDAYFDDVNTTIAAMFKHLGAYGAPAGGLNGGRTDAPELTVRDYYLRPWRRAAVSGSRGLMPSHNTLLGVPAHGSPWLLRDRIRGEFNQSLALVVSDTGDVAALGDYRVCAGDAECAARAVVAGVDIEQVPGHTYLSLPQAVAAGLVPQGDVDDAVRRVLTHKFSLRLFDAPFTDESLAAAVVNAPAHRALAQTAAEEGAVLLVNRGRTLPLKADGSLRVAVVGPNGGCGPGGSGAGTLPLCDAQAAMLGNYASQGTPPPTGVATVAEALAASGAAASVTFARGCNIDDDDLSLLPAAVAAAAAADVVVAVLGDSVNSCGEGMDRDTLDLPGGQLALLAAVAGTGKPVVVVLVHGRTATFGATDGNALLANVSALLAAWRPGQMGGPAIARLLTGAANPSGRLPLSWLRHVGHTGSGASPWLQQRVSLYGGPATGAEGRRYGGYWRAASPATPLFPFGFGLSYTTFALGGLTAALNGGNTSHPVTVSFTASNTGAAAGAVVAQVYAQDPVGATLSVRPWKRLVGFARVGGLAPGETRPVTLPLRADDFGFVGDDGVLAVRAGNYTLSLGQASDDDAGAVARLAVPPGAAFPVPLVP
jgi:beta-glucosidase